MSSGAITSLIPDVMDLTITEKLGASGLRMELQGFLAKVTAMEDTLHALKKTLTRKQKYITSLETNLRRIEDQNSTLKNEVAGLQKDNQCLRYRLSESPSPSHRMYSRTPSPMPSERELHLGNELDRVLQENESLKQKILGLEHELSQTIQRLEQRKSRQVERCHEVETLLKHASKELRTVEMESEETTRMLAELKEGGAKSQYENILQLQKSSLSAAEVENLRDRLFAAHRQIDVLESDFREEHEQRLTAERDLARVKASMRDLERECDTLRLQVQFLQEDFYQEREEKKALERSIKSRDNLRSAESETSWSRSDTEYLDYRRERSVSPENLSITSGASYKSAMGRLSPRPSDSVRDGIHSGKGAAAETFVS